MTFKVFFALYTAVAVILLALGLGPALAKAIPSVQEAFQTWARGDGPVSTLSSGIAQASLFSGGLGRVSIDYLFSALNIGFGVFIVWQRPMDWTVRLLGVALVGTGSVFNFQAHGVLLTTWDFLSGAHLGFHAISGAAYVHALLIFPNGKIFPRWSTGLLVVVYLLMILAFVFMVIPPALGNPLIEKAYAVDRLNSIVSIEAIFFVLFFGLLIPIVGASSQIYRYHTIYTPQEQQQTKLVVWGIGVAFTAGMLFILVNVGMKASLWLSSPGQALDQLGDLVLVNFPLLFAIVPVALVVAMLRYGLWDADVIINRTMVYGTLTIALAGTYFISIVLLQVGFRAITNQGSNIAIVLSTLAIAALFHPLRGRIQNTIDRRFYRRKYDAANTLAAFSARMRDEVDLTILTDELVSVVKDTIQPVHASLWLRNKN